MGAQSETTIVIERKGAWLQKGILVERLGARLEMNILIERQGARLKNNYNKHQGALLEISIIERLGAQFEKRI